MYKPMQGKRPFFTSFLRVHLTARVENDRAGVVDLVQIGDFLVLDGKGVSDASIVEQLAG
jgi:hypothetical protein